MGTHPIFESDFDCLTDRMDEKLEQLEAKVDQIGDKLDLLIRHLVPAGLPLNRNTDDMSILTESAETDMHDRLDNLKLSEEQVTEKEVKQLETWMNSTTQRVSESDTDVGPSFVEVKTGEFQDSEPIEKKAAQCVPNLINRILRRN